LAVLVFPVRAAEKAKLPKILTVVSYGLGSGAFVVVSGFREAIEKNTPMKVRQEPYGDDIGRLLPLRAKEGHISVLGAGGITPAYYGLLDFAAEAWGPQPIRMIHPGGRIYLGFFVRNTASDIKTVADVKGKRVAFLSGSPALGFSAYSFLAFANLTKDDVKWVRFGGYTPFARSVLEGTADVSIDDTTATIVKELASSRFGARYLPFPLEDKEGWKRMTDMAPWFTPAQCTIGDGIPKKGAPLGGYFYPIVVAYNWLDDHIAYTSLKAILDGYESYKDMHFYCTFYDPKVVKELFDFDVMLPIPYHPGAIKYWREKGYWTSAHDKWQEKLLAQEPKRRAEFEADKKAWKAKYGWEY